MRDDGQRLGDRAPPRLLHAARGQHVHCVGRAEPLEREAQPPLRQQPEDAVARRRAQSHEMHPPAQPLAQRTVLERGQPQRGHEIAPAQLGQHPRIDLVGLARQRRDVANLARVGHLDLPAGRGQPVADPDRAAHHLHTRPDLPAHRQHEPGQAVLVGRHHPLAADRAAVAERAPRRAPIRPIDADILHRGASLHGLSYRPTLSLLRGGPPSRRKGLRHDIPCVSTLASTCRVGAAALLHSRGCGTPTRRRRRYRLRAPSTVRPRVRRAACVAWIRPPRRAARSPRLASPWAARAPVSAEPAQASGP